VARLLVEADHHMKLIGMGLAQGTLGVTSYLDRIQPPPGGSDPPLDVLRWWFTLDYLNVLTTKSRDAFELRGRGVKVLSENELLSERGERVPTGRSDEPNRLFASSFTEHFGDLATKYPVYAELQNVFDLALASAVIREVTRSGKVQWQPTFFGESGEYEVGGGHVPSEVNSIVNCRVVDRKHFIVGVSGGVSADTRPLARMDAMDVDEYGLLQAERAGSAPPRLLSDAWWWD
jgi:hypothetical protein